jgi:PAS domain S-box-containing protein
MDGRIQDLPEWVNALLSEMDEGYVIQNAKGQITQFNQQACDILRLTSEQLLGRTSMDPRWNCIRPDGSPYPGTEHPSMKVMQTGKPIKNEIMGIQWEKEVKWISINAIGFLDAGAGLPLYVLAVFKDITELISVKERLALLFEHIPIGIAFNDSQMRWQSTNPAFEQFLGYSSQELLQKTSLDVSHPDDKEKVKAALKNIHLQPKTFKGSERRFIHKSGKTVWGRGGGVRLSQSWTGISFVSFVEDVTDQKLAQIELDRIRNEEKINQASFISHAKLTALAEMAAGVAHEINNPLAIITGLVDDMIYELEENGKVGEEVKPGLMKIIQMSDRISKIIKGLKSFSRENKTETFQNFNLKSLMESTLELCWQRFRQHGILVKQAVPLEITLRGCRPEISQVILNLLNNSHDAIMHQIEKWILIEAQETPQEVTVTITDSGKGIPEKVARRMFEPFFTTKDFGKGTGLGLSTSVGIMESHGGSLKFHEDSKNTKFTAHFPKEKTNL